MNKNENLDQALGRLGAKHGEHEAKRLRAAIEIVVHGAPLEGWNELLFAGTAARLCDQLASFEASALTPVTLLDALSRDENNAVGSGGWELMWHWKVAVDAWASENGATNAGDLAECRVAYEGWLRALVHRELVSYYFDHAEHKRDVEQGMADAGMDHVCDAHAVGCYFSTVADIGVVRGLFAKIATLPSTMSLETYIGAVRTAYEAAGKAGFGDELRRFEAIERDIEARRGGPRYLTDYDQRLIDPADTSMQFRTGDTLRPETGHGDQDGPALPLSAEEARVVIVQSVVNIQSNHNAFGTRITDEDIERIKEGVAEASPSVLARVMRDIKNWFIGFSVTKLLAMLFGGS